MTTLTVANGPVSDERFEELLNALKGTNFRYDYGESTDGAYIGRTHLFFTSQKALEKYAKDNRLILNLLGKEPHLSVAKKIQWNYDDKEELTTWVNEGIGIFVEYLPEVSDVQM